MAWKVCEKYKVNCVQLGMLADLVTVDESGRVTRHNNVDRIDF